MNKSIKRAAAVILTGIITASAGSSAMPAPVIAVEALPDTAYYDNEAQELDSEIMTKSILRYKMIFGSTDRYPDFYHDYYKHDGYTGIEFTWLNDDERINFGITDGGTIYYYTKYDYNRSYKSIVIPTITKEQAVELAINWQKKMNPEYSDYFSSSRSTVSYRHSGAYNVCLYAYIGDKELSGQCIYVRLTPDGELSSYDSTGVASKLGAPADEGKSLIGETEAESILRDAIPFRLVYRSFYSYDREEGRTKAELKLVYMPGEGFDDTVVNAVDGSLLAVINPGGGLYYSASDEMVAEDSAMVQTAGNGLTGVEQSAVELQDSFLTVEAVKELLVNNALLDFDESYSFEKTTVTRNVSPYTEKDRYVRNIVWSRPAEYSTEWASVSCDAETGELISFESDNYYFEAVDAYDDSSSKAESRYSGEALTAAAEKALEALCPYSGEYVYSEYNDNTDYNLFTVVYTRYNNGVEVLNDTVRITLNSKTGLVSSYRINRIDAELESTVSVIGANNAADSYFNTLGIRLAYLAAVAVEDGRITLPENMINNREKTPVPVYSFGPDCLIDAKSGKLLNYSGEEYVPQETVYFTAEVFRDIDETMYQIPLLFNMGIIEGAESFNPESTITQNDFIKMLNNVTGNSVEPENGENAISRQLAARIVVESLGYGEIAALDGIFKLPFDDGGRVDAEYTGYVAIAYALGLFDGTGESFDPAAELTRAEAACMICSYVEYEAAKEA